jgi:hypothetical protein
MLLDLHADTCCWSCCARTLTTITYFLTVNVVLEIPPSLLSVIVSSSWPCNLRQAPYRSFSLWDHILDGRTHATVVAMIRKHMWRRSREDGLRTAPGMILLSIVALWRLTNTLTPSAEVLWWIVENDNGHK